MYVFIDLFVANPNKSSLNELYPPSSFQFKFECVNNEHWKYSADIMIRHLWPITSFITNLENGIAHSTYVCHTEESGTKMSHVNFNRSHWNVFKKLIRPSRSFSTNAHALSRIIVHYTIYFRIENDRMKLRKHTHVHIEPWQMKPDYLDRMCCCIIYTITENKIREKGQQKRANEKEKSKMK